MVTQNSVAQQSLSIRTVFKNMSYLLFWNSASFCPKIDSRNASSSCQDIWWKVIIEGIYAVRLPIIRHQDSVPDTVSYSQADVREWLPQEPLPFLLVLFEF